MRLLAARCESLKELAVGGGAERIDRVQKWMKQNGHTFKGKAHLNIGWSGDENMGMHKIYSPRFKTEADRLYVEDWRNGPLKIVDGRQNVVATL